MSEALGNRWWFWHAGAAIRLNDLPRPVAFWLVSMLMVDAVAWTWTTILLNTSLFPWWSGLFFLLALLGWGVELSQVSLLAIWFALSTRPWLLRFTALVCGVSLWSLPFFDTPSGWAGFASMCIVQMLFVLLGLAGARLAGFRVARPAMPQTCSLRKLQFTMARLLQVVTVAAICLGVITRSYHTWSEWRETLQIAAVGAALALAALWAILRPGRIWWRLALLSLLVYLGARILGSDGSMDFLMFILVPSQAVVLVVSFMVFRRCGYRVIRRPQSAASEQAMASAV